MNIEELVAEIDSLLLKVFSPARWKKLTAKLERLLQETWTEQQEKAIEAALATLENADEKFTSEDLEVLLATLEEHLGRRLSELLGEDVATIQRTAYEVSFKDLNMKLEFGTKDARVLRWLEQDALYWIETYYERELRDQLLTVMKDVVVSGESRMHAGKRLQAELGRTVKKTTAYWEGLANHITTRTREFANVSGYVQAKIEYFEVRAVLDNRTSDICRYMHGRIFKVSDARTQREKIMRAETPEEIKRVAPWVRAEKIQRWPTLKLVEEGVILPPYHWQCRTATVSWSEEDIRGHKVEELTYGENLTAAQREALGIFTKDEYSNWVRDLKAAQRNIDYHPDDIVQDMKDHAPEFEIATRDEYITLAKEIVANAKEMLVQMYKDGNLQFLFFGEQGISIVDTQFFIRGCFPHVKAGGLDKAFDAFKRKCLWLQQNKNN